MMKEMILNVLFPKFCLGCKKWGGYMCSSCKQEMKTLSSFICPVCNSFIYPEMSHSSCRETIITGVVCLLKYHGITRKIVKSIKYQLQYDIYKELSDFIEHSKLLQEFIKNHPDCYLQPIPLHPQRLKMRGFNQSHELAILFRKVSNFPLIDILIRVKNTTPQAQILSKKKRQENINHAFRTKNEYDVKGKNIILVDDVYTSGSTCQEAAKVLKQKGAHCVYVWALARD